MPVIKGYHLGNEEKYDRAINGAPNNEDELHGGVGEDAPDELILAAYDRLAGLITKDGRKVKTGCFCNLLESKKQSRRKGEVVIVPIEKPKVILLINDLEGNKVEIEEGKELTPELKAAETIAKRKSDKKIVDVKKRADEREAKKNAKAKKDKK